MAKTNQKFNLRFYASYCQDESISLKKIIENFEQKGKLLPPLLINQYYRQIKIHSNNSQFENSISGYFITYRDDLFLKGNFETSEESPLPLADNEAIIEKSYFILFYSKDREVLVYQVNSNFGRITHFNLYITDLTQHITENKQKVLFNMNEIGAEDYDLDHTTHLSQVEYKLARPRRKTPLEGEDPWIQSNFDYMRDMQAGTIRTVLSTRSGKGLNMSLIEKVKILRACNQTRLLRVKLEDLEEPIDLLANILKHSFILPYNLDGTISDDKIYTEIRKAKGKYDKIIDRYLT